jgi:hypothetical protein
MEPAFSKESQIEVDKGNILKGYVSLVSWDPAEWLVYSTSFHSWARLTVELSYYREQARLNYLLDNWVAETTVCGVSDNPYTGDKGCERTPLKVMEYLGYKSMKDPLFKADKTMLRLRELVPAAKDSEYSDASEIFSLAAEEASGMAFVSSWAEANPGGGKDRTELFIERAKKNVLDARSSLATIVDILELGKS